MESGSVLISIQILLSELKCMLSTLALTRIPTLNVLIRKLSQLVFEAYVVECKTCHPIKLRF